MKRDVSVAKMNQQAQHAHEFSSKSGGSHLVSA